MDNVEIMFSIPLIRYKIENWEHNKKRILDALPPEELHKGYNNGRNDQGMITDYHAQHDHKEELAPYIPVVVNIIKPYLKQFAPDIPIHFTDIWYQKYYKHDYHMTHNHGGVGWSGIIYVELDADSHDSTYFFPPFGNPFDGANNEYKPKVEEGDMLLFPSSILHESSINRTDKRRTIISYNIAGTLEETRYTIPC